jgi:hypothetical protein
VTCAQLHESIAGLLMVFDWNRAVAGGLAMISGNNSPGATTVDAGWY